MSDNNGERCPKCGASKDTLVNLRRNNDFKPSFTPGVPQCFYCGWDGRVVTTTAGQATLNLTKD